MSALDAAKPFYFKEKGSNETQSTNGACNTAKTPIYKRFMKRLTVGADAEIIALQAEDHYLRVFAGEKNELIRYRFSDAIDEVHELLGLQVHRSFWVSTAAIESIRRAGRSYEIKMTSGFSVPVSRSYRYTLKDAGLLDKFLGQVPN